MSSYDFLAGCYDELTTDVGYPAWADYLEAHFRRKGLPGRTVLDLACGTGSLTWELAARGYEMIGVDRSPEMLAEAAAKSREDVETPPIFLCQSMDKLDLYGTIDACVCCLDSVNYVTDPRQLKKAFARVWLFLMPGGLFCSTSIRRLSCVGWMDRSFWTRRRIPTASGGRNMRSAAGSVPILWTFSAWIPAPGCGSGGRSCTGSGPMSRRN